jgi:hypothetical protein
LIQGVYDGFTWYFQCNEIYRDMPQNASMKASKQAFLMHATPHQTGQRRQNKKAAWLNAAFENYR